MNTTAIAKALDTLAANAEFNFELMDKYLSAVRVARRSDVVGPDAPSAAMFKAAHEVIKGYTVFAYFIPAKGRKGFIRWHLSDRGKVVARANLVKILEGAE
jgi:hypothetical protein